MSEKLLQNYFCKKVREAGGVAYKINGSAHRGVPDILAIYAGTTIFVEFKNPNGKGRLSKLQLITISDMRANGADVRVCARYVDADEILYSLGINDD